MNRDDVNAQARAAISAWGSTLGPPLLIRHRENAVFQVTFNGGARAALRLHREGYQTDGAIRSEMIWTAHLARTGFPCPRPIKTETGAYFTKLETGRTASLVSWIDAEPIGEMGAKFGGSKADHVALYSRLGKLIASLHTESDAMEPSHIQRCHWDISAFVGETPLWGAYWDNPALTKAETELVQAARAGAKDDLNAMIDPDYGLIHADLLQENVLQKDDDLWLIDFDDGGFGYRLYDLATALIQHAELPYLPELNAALCAGYNAARSTHVSPEQVTFFMMLRAFASAGWIINRESRDPASQRFYADRAVRLAQNYLS